MNRSIWLTTSLLGLFYIIAWALTGNWFSPADSQASLRLLLQQALLCGVGFIFWGAFFAQFILPLQTIRHRFQAIHRLFLHLMRGHGPAIFIENGVPREHAGEEDKEGPGLIWLDTASAAVLRNKQRFTRVVGPGIYFTRNGETIGGAVDLRTQKQMIGPRPQDNPFASAPANPGDEASRLAYEAARQRANETLAYTADHHPIIPNIIVIFKIKAQGAQGADPGSRFGFDEEAVFRAVTSTMVDVSEENRHNTVEWNELPAYIAADVWREMLEKYPFNEIFQPLPFSPPENPPPPAAAAEAEQPQETRSRSLWREYLDDLNRWLAHQAHILNLAFFPPQDAAADDCQPPEAPPRPEQQMTVLEFIQQVVRQRLAQPLAPEIDKEGRPTGRWYESPEYRQMEERGIQVKSVIINNLRLKPEMEDYLENEWGEKWLQRARKRDAEITDYLDEVAEEVKAKATIDLTEYLARRINRSARQYRQFSGDERSRRALQHILADLRHYLTGNNRLRQSLRAEIEEVSEMQRQITEDAMRQEDDQ